jgi:cytochrome c
MRRLLASTFATLALATAGAAAGLGTADEAQAMLQRAVEAIRADKAAGLAAITAGDPRFLDRDLHVICGGPDGRFSAYAGKPWDIGDPLRTQADKAGKPVGEIFYQEAVEGEMHTVEYRWPKPGEIGPSDRVAFVTRVADQVCFVGYYK